MRKPRVSIAAELKTVSAPSSMVLKEAAPLLIVDRRRPVARLEPVEDGRLSRLIREGIVRPARAPLTNSLFSSQPPRPKGDASAVAALLAERRDSR